MTGEELLKRLVNLPDKECLEKYEPESCDQRDMRAIVDAYIARLAEVSDLKHDPGGGIDRGSQDSIDGLEGGRMGKDMSMSEKREKLEILIDETIKVRKLEQAWNCSPYSAKNLGKIVENHSSKTNGQNQGKKFVEKYIAKNFQVETRRKNRKQAQTNIVPTL